jgi:hypothetical protein
MNTVHSALHQGEFLIKLALDPRNRPIKEIAAKQGKLLSSVTRKDYSPKKLYERYFNGFQKSTAQFGGSYGVGEAYSINMNFLLPVIGIASKSVIFYSGRSYSNFTITCL